MQAVHSLLARRPVNRVRCLYANSIISARQWTIDIISRRQYGTIRGIVSIFRPVVSFARHSRTYAIIAKSKATHDDRANYWLQTLQDEYRINAGTAVPDTWRRLLESGDAVPMQGIVANELWRILLNDERLHDELFKYALRVKSESGIIFDRLYEYLLRRLMHLSWRTEDSHAQLVLRWHQQLLDTYFIRPGALNELVHAAKLSKSNLRIFRSLYRRSSCLPKQGIYDELVPELCRLNEWTLAIEWHFFLYSQRDFPRQSNFLQQAFRARPTMEEALAEFVSHQMGLKLDGDASAGMNSQSSTASEHPEVFNPASLSRIGDDAFKAAVARMDEKPRHAPLSDEFCARLLATQGLSISSAVNYFQMFDHGKLGPLALRELMARADNLDDAKDNLQAFEAADITVGISMYPRVVRHFLETDQFDLLQNLISSDLHPDTLHDQQLQNKLLKQYTMQGDQMSARRTVEILRLLDPARYGSKHEMPRHIVPAPLHSAAERFTAICETRQLQNIQVVFDDQISQGVIIQNQELEALLKFCLRPAEVRDEESKESLKLDLNFVTNALLRLIKTKYALPPTFLIKILATHGQRSQLGQVFRIFAFLVDQYYRRPRLAQSSNYLGAQIDRLTNPMEEIRTYLAPADVHNFASTHKFDRTAASIVEWGAKSALPQIRSTEAYHADPSGVFWVGLRFLSELHAAGFSVSVESIASAISRRLVQLEGPGTSRREKNRFIKTSNRFTLEEILISIEQVWIGDRLFPELYNSPGKPVDREPRAVPRYYRRVQDTFVDQDVHLPEIDDAQSDPPGRVDPWTYKQFNALCDQYGGSMLDGLIYTSNVETNPRLSRDDRIRKRMHLRYFFLGTTSCSEQVTQWEWDEHVRRSAIEADHSLVHAGLC